MAPEDEQIDGKLALRIAGSRDVEAEAELCRRFWPRLRAFGLRRLKREQDAVDLAQQVLVITIEALRSGLELLREFSGIGGASNNWALRGTRTATGRPAPGACRRGSR